MPSVSSPPRKPSTRPVRPIRLWRCWPRAEEGPLNELQRARLERLRAQLAFALRRGSDAPPLLLRAAQRLEPLDAAARA